MLLLSSLASRHSLRTLQPFIGRFPVSVVFDRELTISVVSVKVGAMFGRSRIGSYFLAVLTRGRLGMACCVATG
jgi:hypothetical protein